MAQYLKSPPATAAPTSRCKAVRVALKGNVTAANVSLRWCRVRAPWRLDITGAEVKGMLEDGMQAARRGRVNRPTRIPAGPRWDVNGAQAHAPRDRH